MISYGFTQKVPELLQKVLSSARNIAEAQNCIEGLENLGALFEQAWGIWDVMLPIDSYVRMGLARDSPRTTDSMATSTMPEWSSQESCLKLAGS